MVVDTAELGLGSLAVGNDERADVVIGALPMLAPPLECFPDMPGFAAEPPGAPGACIRGSSKLASVATLA